MTTCPEIVSQTDSNIVLSTYERTNGTSVVIGCKDFGRHVAEPTSVVCLDTGAWSETPNLKCEIGLDQREKIILGAGLASALLVLLTLISICCYCCCCRRRRRHYRDRYKGWRGSSGNWRDGWSGWTSRWFGGGGSSDDIKRSNRFYEYNSNPSKSFVNEYHYSSNNKDGRNSFSKKKSNFFGRFRRHSDGDKHSIDRQEFYKGSNFLRESGKYSDRDRNSVDRKEFSKRSNFLRRSERLSDVDKYSNDRPDFYKRSNFLRQSGKYSDMDKRSVDRQDFSKRSNFLREYGWQSDMDRYPGDRLESRRKGWRGWTDSLRDNWIGWRSRMFGDSPADGSVRRRDNYYDNSYSGRGFRQGHGRYSDGDRQSVDRREMMRSRRHSNEYMPPPGEFQSGRRYSDPAMFANRGRYARREISYDSKPDEVNYHRVRRYSDPMVYRSEYTPQRQEVSYESRMVPSNDSYKPSYNIIRMDDSRRKIIEREPTTFELINKPVVRYADSEIYRHTEPATILDPVYYKDPQYYRIGSRQSGTLIGGETRYSGGALIDGDTRYTGGAVLNGQVSYGGGALYSGQSIKQVSGHRNVDGLLRLPPITLDKLSKVIDIDVNKFNQSYGTRLASSPRILELDGNRQATTQLVGTDVGLTNSAHYEVMTVNPSSGYFVERQEFPVESSTKKGGHYTLYQGKGKTTDIFNDDTDQKLYF